MSILSDSKSPPPPASPSPSPPFEDRRLPPPGALRRDGAYDVGDDDEWRWQVVDADRWNAAWDERIFDSSKICRRSRDMLLFNDWATRVSCKLEFRMNDSSRFCFFLFIWHSRQSVSSEFDVVSCQVKGCPLEGCTNGPSREEFASQLGNTILVKLKLWELVIVFNKTFWSATNLCLRYASAKCGR